ncbi:MAG: glycosyltransferase family 2 protein [Candidatus Doudnabacteria bacterium]|nr:glycosyltransferase family 2 protein [Candidatus Doudnabacteria bacterium]
MHNPIISVLMPTKNGEVYIARAIVSIQTQTFSDWELVVVDDGSTDGTAGVVNALAARDKRIRLVRVVQPDGAPGALREGMQHVRGQFVARLDDDDVWVDPTKLAQQLAYMEVHAGCVLVGTGTVVANEQGRELWRYVHPHADPDIRSILLGKNCFVNSSVLFRRSVYLQTKGYRVEWRFIEDYDLWLQMALYGSVANLPLYATVYTQRASSVTSTRHRAMYWRTIRLAHAHRREYPGYWRGQLRNVARLLRYWFGPKQ